MPAFKLKVNGRDIFTYSGEGVEVGFSSEWEQRKAARFVGVSWLTFRDEWDGEEQSDAVADYRASRQLETAIREASKAIPISSAH